MLKEFIEKYCPEITKKIAENKCRPTTEERITALENAVADLAIQTMGVDTND